MGLEQDIELLSRVALFQDFEVEQLRLIAFGTERIHLRAGNVLFERGQASDGGYVVASGIIDIITQKHGHHAVLDSCGEAALIGELALITENRRAMTAVAREHSELLFIPRSLFHRLLQEYPKMANLLHARITHNVKALLGQIEKIHERLSAIPPLEKRNS